MILGIDVRKYDHWTLAASMGVVHVSPFRRDVHWSSTAYMDVTRIREKNRRKDEQT